MNENRLPDYIDHMQQAAADVCSFVEGLAKDDFLADKRTQQAVIMSLIIIGEAATKVMDGHKEFAEAHAQVPWRSMRGMRNRIAHGYFDINLDVVWETVQTAVPELLKQLPAVASLLPTHDGTVRAEIVITQAQPVLDAFYDAVVACGRKPLFKPSIRVATTPDATRYDPSSRAIVLVPYEVLPPVRRAAMDRFAAIGTLGLSGHEQYGEVFNNLLVAHELGHWLQEMALRPLSRWQAEYQANQIMVAFWRDHPAKPPAAATEMRLANFVAQSPNMPSPVPNNPDMSIEDYFNANLAEIESNPMLYAGFQKRMVRQAIAEQPAPSFCELVMTIWPDKPC